jgi:hypothetical protein
MSHNSETDSSLCCENCGSELGVSDVAISGWKIYKWSIRLQKDNQSEPFTFSSQKWISSLLLSSSENTGVRRFVVEPSSLMPKPGIYPPSILVSFHDLEPSSPPKLIHTALALHTRSLFFFLLSITITISTTQRPHTCHQSLS